MIEIIQENRAEILQCLHIDEAVLNELLAKNAIPNVTAQHIRGLLLDCDKNTMMIDHLLTSSIGVLDDFIEIINKYNQQHVAALFVKGNYFQVVHLMAFFFCKEEFGTCYHHCKVWSF